jgi:hypothetical protein
MAERTQRSKLTLADLARAKDLPVAFLRGDDVCLRDLPGGGVGIPYWDATGLEEIAVKQRTALIAKEGSRWPAGVPLAAYGQWRLDQARRSGFLILGEGESDCWALWYYGLPALGLPGANTVKKTLAKEHLEGIDRVYVHREPDAGGATFIQGVAEQLAALGFSGRAFELRMPNGIKDPSDLHVRDPKQFKAALQMAIKDAVVIPLQQRNGRSHRPLKDDKDTPKGLATTRLDTISPQPVRWLVPGYLPRGKLVMLAGDGGHGKSTLTLHLTACLTTGRPCFGVAYEPLPACEVLLVSCEDDYADTVVPRLLSAGAELSRVFRVDGIKDKDGNLHPFSLDHLVRVEEELESKPAVRLVVIDPAGAYVGRTGKDDYKDSELRTLLDPLAELAARKQVTIIIVKHLAKGITAKAVHRVNGSAAYTNSVRAAFLVTPDPQDDTRKFFLPLKFNLGPKPAGLAYRLQAPAPEESDGIVNRFSQLEGEDRARLAGQLFRLEWLGVVAIDADAALADGARKDRPGAKDTERAAEWLETFLAKRPAESLACVKGGNAALDLRKDLKWWRDSILKDRLQGKPRKTGSPGKPQHWWFTLPTHPWPFPGLEESEESEEGEESNTNTPDSSGQLALFDGQDDEESVPPCPFG